MNNVLYVDKPIGMTSFDLCFKLRKVLNTKKIGHTGTLDPNASGVMIILFDNATKTNQFLVSDRKTYEARVLFGISTDTLDIDGNITDEKEYIIPDRDRIVDTLNSFMGKSMQEVPITSAIKINGKRLYQYQLANQEVELPIREIEVFSIELSQIFDDGFSFICEVSSGTYIRSLVRDILVKLDLIGTLKSLRRLAINDISVEQCDKLDDILKGNYHKHNVLDLLKLRYFSMEYADIDAIKNGKRINIDCNEDKILFYVDDEALAIYQKDKIKGDYYILRGLW